VAEPGAKVAPPKPAGPPREITVTEGVTVRELSEKMEIKTNDVLKKLLMRGVVTTVNRPLDLEVARQIALEFNHAITVVSYEESEVIEERKAGSSQKLPRSPVVTVMGHVDHGKTSLLDAIRETRVVDLEHGGITQHIGAYSVAFKNRTITFLDTPGHEAFTLMRARGARVTDVVILVVAADDGVMPQTIEAIDHARAAGVPIVVAINKIDKPEANVDRVKKQLADRDLLVEDWGGQVVCVLLSAKQKQGISDLLEMILLVADMQDLRADPSIPASGTVLEARLDRSRGPVATVLVRDGTLRISDAFIAGAVSGKVRAMFDDAGGKIEVAGPSAAVEVLGLQGVPQAGDIFKVLAEEWKARQIGAFRQQKIREDSLQRTSRMTLNQLFEKIQEGTIRELPLVLKADVQGSLEALNQMLGDLPTEKIKLRVIRSSTGAISESDVLLATTTNAIVIGFNVRPERKAAELAEKENVDIRLHTVVYDVTSEIRAAMVGLLEPTIKEVFVGRAEVRDTFSVPKFGIVAGCMVTEGRMTRNAQVRLLRDNVVVYSGRAASLRRFKDDVNEVKSGFECGIGLEKYNDVKPGDIIEAYKTEKVANKELSA
jgi:translation initiation factor IF-2